MIYIALLEGVALLATALTFAGCVRSLVRQQARERATLIDQICHLAGRTWTPPPAEQASEPFDPDEVSDPRFELSPTQLNDY